jgi:uncharacterized repeat protein (TIGR01451 family)
MIKDTTGNPQLFQFLPRSAWFVFLAFGILLATAPLASAQNLCTYSVSPGSYSLPANSISVPGAVTVTTAANCQWSTSPEAFTPPGWFWGYGPNYNCGGTCAGTAAITLEATANANTPSTPNQPAPSRTGTLYITKVLPNTNVPSPQIVVGTVQVTQPAGCQNYHLSSTGTQIPASGGSGIVNVTVDMNQCFWSVDLSNLPSWISNVGGGGWDPTRFPGVTQGNSLVSFSVPPNSGPARTASLTIAGQTFTVTQAGGGPTLSIDQTHSGAFRRGDVGVDSYTITVQNIGFTPTVGLVTVMDTVPAGLTATKISGEGWNCTQPAGPCTRSDALAPGMGGNTGPAYPALTLSVNVSNNAPASVNNVATVSGGGSPSETAGDLTAIGNCAYSISPSSASFGAVGGSGTVSVTAPGSCTWKTTVDPNAPWITTIFGDSGSGNGTVTYVVAPYYSSGSRNGTITIAGRTFTVTQASGNCTYSVDHTSQSFPAEGNGDTVLVTTSPGCGWTATSNASWITIGFGVSGIGSHSVGFSVAHNTGSARTGTLTIAGLTFTVTQGAAGGSPGSGCQQLSVAAPTTQNFTSAGGTGNVSILAPADCTWTATVDVSWITITSAITGSGNGTVSYTVAPYDGPADRTGHFRFGDGPFAGSGVLQKGVSCNISTSPTGQSFKSDGGTGTIAVTIPQVCNWTASTDATWITITSGSGTGNGTIAFSVAANPNADSVNNRVGTIVISVTNPGFINDYQRFSVTQACGCAVMAVSPTVLQFNISHAGDPSPLPQTFQVQNVGAATLNWRAEPPHQRWMTISSISGAAPSMVTVTVNAAALREGIYDDTIFVSTSSVVAVDTPTQIAVHVQFAVGASLVGKGPTHPFAIPDRGGVSVTTDDSADLSTGYARIGESPEGMTPPGEAIFGFRSNNVLVSETGVPAVPEISSGRIYAEISSTANTSLNTGLAIANPNNSPANINFFFTDANGNAAGSGTVQIPAGQQIAEFLNKPPFKVYPGTTFQGTFSFTSDVPVGVVALRGLTNERGDFLMSTLPVIDTTAAPISGVVVLPHFADGGGWTTEILLVNPTDSAMTGGVQFINNNGGAVNLTIAGLTSDTFAYSIPSRSAKKFATAGLSSPAGAGTVHGSVRIIPAGGGGAPAALLVFSHKVGAVTVAEAGVPLITGNAFRMYVETGSDLDSGIAVSNLSSSSASVTVDITDLTGSPVTGISPVTFTLPASGQAADVLSDLFPSLQNPFKGVLRITTTSSSGLSVVGLRTRVNERGDYLVSTISVSNESNPTSGTELLFPHLADGGGYTTQFILFSGAAGQTSTGTLSFFRPDGTPLSLNVN